MNIIYYIVYFPKLSETFVLNEIYELEKRGHNVAVCALIDPNEETIHQEFDNLNIQINYASMPSYTDVTELASREVLHPRVIKNTFYRAPLRHHAANLFWAKRCIRFVDSLDWNPDHFHSHFLSKASFAAQYMSEYYQKSLTVTTHANDLYEEPVNTLLTKLLQRISMIVTISKYNKKYIRQQFSSNIPVDVIRAGIRPEKFAPTEETEPNRVLTTARLIRKKGLSYALEAVNIAIDKMPDIEYHIIGTGELKPNLANKVKTLGINKNVTFLDNVGDQRLITELDEARCFLLPCIIAESGARDGIPVALMEAMAMKTPPVSTTISGIPELIDHKHNGLLTEPRRPEATADALVSLLKNDSEREVYAERAREKVLAEFNVKSEVKKLEKAFQKANNDAW
jgi:glycosyltransferase involved in cell wall biosynthesis